MKELQVGDKVKLKSGGPTMVIDQRDFKRVSEKSSEWGYICTCVWFDKQGKPQRESFSEKALEKA